MYPVSDDYKQKIMENNRDFDIRISINHSKGELQLTEEDLVQGSFTFNQASQSGDDFTIGGIVANDISFSIFNEDEYENINFMGASVTVHIGLVIVEPMDAHFIQPSQPSKIAEFADGVVEYVMLGQFNVDSVNRLRSSIELKGIDDMILLDKPYSKSNLTYPATLMSIYLDICGLGGMTPGTSTFPNEDYIVNERPKDDLSIRDILGFVAELSGKFAKVDRLGSLELVWYESTDIEINPDNRFSLELSDEVVQIKGVMVEVEGEGSEEEGVIYLAGNREYSLDLSENILLQDDYETVLPNILNSVKDTKFLPYSCEWRGNPAMEAGDIITHITIDGDEIETLVTKSTYNYLGKSNTEGKGKADVNKGFKGSTDKRISIIRDRIEKDLGRELTSLEQAQLNATKLIANTLGGFTTVREDGFYISDNKDLDRSTKIWKWGVGGFGYSDDGGQTYTTGITADGSIVANIITADMINTGVLKSLNNKTIINLNNGTFNLADGLIYDGEDLVFKIENEDVDSTVIMDRNGFKIDTNIIVDSNIDYNKYYEDATINARGIELSHGRSGLNFRDITLNKYGIIWNNVGEALDGVNGGLNLELSDDGYATFKWSDIKIEQDLVVDGFSTFNDNVILNGNLRIMGDINTEQPIVNMNGQFHINGHAKLNDYRILTTNDDYLFSSGDNYMMFTDGTMICYRNYRMSYSDIRVGEVIYRNLTLPREFVGIPEVSVTKRMSSSSALNNAQHIVNIDNITSSQVNVAFVHTGQSSSKSTVSAHIIAIGRWK